MSEFAKRPEIDVEEFERRLRQPAAPKPEADPLAELARILGENDDPYKKVFAAEARQPQRREPGFAPLPQAAAPALDDLSTQGVVPPQHDSYHNAGAHPAYEPTRPQDDAWDDYDAPAYEERRKPFMSRAAMMAAAVVGVAVIGIGATYAFKGKLPGSREIATIQALNTPVKVAPPTSEVDHQTTSASVLDKGAGQGVTKVVSREEQPVDLNTLPQKTARVIPMRQAEGQVAATPAAQSQQGAPTSIANLIEPRKVKTVSVRPDGSIIPADGSGAGASPPLPVARPVMTTAAAPASGDAATPKAATPKTVARVSATPPAADAAPRPAPRAAAPAVETPKAKSAALDDETTATTRGGWAAQLAASPSEDEARATASKLGTKYSSELGGRRPSFRKAEVNSKTVYRVRVSGLTKEEATAICQKISGCFVARN